MIYVALCGIMGFIVFDVYRINRIRSEKGYVEVFTDGYIGIITKIGVYSGAGILACFASTDVLLGVSPEILFGVSPASGISADLSGSYLRGFAIGLAGPAGISKYDTDAGMPEPQAPHGNEGTADTIDPQATSVGKQMLYALRRQFLR